MGWVEGEDDGGYKGRRTGWLFDMIAEEDKKEKYSVGNGKIEVRGK